MYENRGEYPYEKIVRILGITGCLALALVRAWLFSTYLGSGNWPRRFHTELDEVFGEGNWKCISEEEKESLIYSTTYCDTTTGTTSEIPGSYKNWIFSKKRLSNKEAFVLELREIAESIAAQEVHRDIL